MIKVAKQQQATAAGAKAVGAKPPGGGGIMKSAFMSSIDWRTLGVDPGTGVLIGAAVGGFAMALKSVRDSDGTKKRRKDQGALKLPLSLPYIDANPDLREVLELMGKYAPKAPSTFNQLLEAVNQLLLLHHVVAESTTPATHEQYTRNLHLGNSVIELLDQYEAKVRMAILNLPLPEKEATGFNMDLWQEMCARCRRLLYNAYTNTNSLIHNSIK